MATIWCLKSEAVFDVRPARSDCSDNVPKSSNRRRAFVLLAAITISVDTSTTALKARALIKRSRTFQRHLYAVTVCIRHRSSNWRRMLGQHQRQGYDRCRGSARAFTWLDDRLSVALPSSTPCQMEGVAENDNFKGPGSRKLPAASPAYAPQVVSRTRIQFSWQIFASAAPS